MKMQIQDVQIQHRITAPQRCHHSTAAAQPTPQRRSSPANGTTPANVAPLPHHPQHRRTAATHCTPYNNNGLQHLATTHAGGAGRRMHALAHTRNTQEQTFFFLENAIHSERVNECRGMQQKPFNKPVV